MPLDVTLPHAWDAPVRKLEVTRCESIPSGTIVEGTWDDAPFKPFVLEGIDVNLVGFGALRGRIEFYVAEQIADALSEVR